MTTETILRCGHCLDTLNEANATEVAGTLVCPACARLAHRPTALRPSAPRPKRRTSLFRRVIVEIDNWCTGRWWTVRLPFVLLFGWIWMRHAASPVYRSFFGGLNLGIHELGHYVFAPLGDLPGVYGGSALQCLVPIAGMAMFLRQRDYFAVAFAWCWLGMNCFEVATYAGDAVRMELPLVTPGGGHPIHDWNYLLGAKGWLRHTESIAAAHRGIAHLCMAVGLAGMAWVVSRMISVRKPASSLQA